MRAMMLLFMVAVVIGLTGVRLLTSDAPTGGTFDAAGIENLGVLCLVFSAGAFVLFVVLCVVKFRKGS